MATLATPSLLSKLQPARFRLPLQFGNEPTDVAAKYLSIEFSVQFD
jgi:hypothetical protein